MTPAQKPQASIIGRFGDSGCLDTPSPTQGPVQGTGAIFKALLPEVSSEMPKILRKVMAYG